MLIMYMSTINAPWENPAFVFPGRKEEKGFVRHVSLSTGFTKDRIGAEGKICGGGVRGRA